MPRSTGACAGATAAALLACGARAHELSPGAPGAAGVAHTTAWPPLPWTHDPWVLVPLLATAALYALGVWRLWRHAGTGHGIRRAQAFAFAGGWLTLALALLSPLDSLSGFLFSAHMVQHELMMLVAAPLLVLGRPLAAWTWAFAARRRQAIGRTVRMPAVRAGWRALTHPLPAWVLHAVALWGWHAPAMFDLATRSAGAHILQHTSFLASALLFWWAVLGADARMHGRGPAMLLLFTTLLHTGALGALLTLAPDPLYATTAAAAASIGTNPLEDQQLGGLIMWVPGSTAYLVAALWVMARLLAPCAPRTASR